ncbi:MAG TPA: hypothetical protein VKZ56_11190 [Membranihabitans sp.]|nr:hypothetical protein [Membranihabitans sp.]
MRSSIWFWVCVCLVCCGLGSCQRTLIDRYTEEELYQIMFDAHTLGLIYNRQEVRTDSLKEAYFKVLEARYGLDEEEFQNLVEGLILNAEMYDRVYQRMGRKAEEMERKSMMDY